MRLIRGRSIRARYTLTVAVASLILFTALGIVLHTLVETKIRDIVFQETERAATSWIGSMRPDRTPPVIPATSVDFLQLVDSAGRVVAANALAGTVPLTRIQPTEEDRILRLDVHSHAGCLLITAVRVSPHEARLLWDGAPHVVYAGMKPPPMLATHWLEVFTVMAVCGATVLTTWMTWIVVGRTLRPVQAIQARMAEISSTDLRLRLPEPAGDDEIGRLARTANRTLSHLEEAVERQRRFASVVSHELKTPVAALRVQMEEFLRYPDEVDPGESIKAGLCAAERLCSMIDDLMVLTRVCAASTPPEPLDLCALLGEELVRNTWRVPVRTHFTGTIEVLGRAPQLTAVLNNLVANAQRHARTGVDVTVRRVGDEAVVTVTDDGDGVRPEDRERVFQPFVRLGDGCRRDPKGSGLGLAIARAVANDHHGSLVMEDSPCGARFVLRLPLAPSGGEPPSAKPSSMDEDDRAGATRPGHR
ncbi:two-component sensor histidine kinase [Sphaerisporangium melleum]|uniref:histidine kinase n=1 Tax=Sphaerisporangium melleum TaxID=321316 RepID=A0A917R059_9ACTN|nr:HAMP domain-containing sensor histidine kinase [Sphaerisporangium melleum]GGK80756.1 two-component sensor histidine kinase [Sphaerisporangium melleum]GII72008.1 two-component sensor histidine kinase [Sphaerisporangium melleum]